MHPDYTNTIVEDLWPGDYIMARVTCTERPSPCRFVDVEYSGVHLYLRLRTESGYEFRSYAERGWGTCVEKV